MLRIYLLLTLLSAVLTNNAQAYDARLYHRLAAFHAPVVFQKTGHNPKADAITRFDFDGDFAGNNNWKNLETAATPAAAYYDVRETKTHYFVMYAYFHPRDYSYFCIPWICHENDLEGVMLTIEKSKSDWQGRVVAIQTLAHDRIYTHEGIGGIRPIEETDVRAPAAQAASKKTAIFIEWGGHGIYAWDPAEQKKLDTDKPTYLYTHEQLMQLAAEKHAKDWLVYEFGPEAQDPNGADHGIYSYELLPIHDELWSRREMVGKGHVFTKLFDFKGERFSIADVPEAFAGEKYGNGRARPPWAWKDMFSGSDNRGEWFLDPAVYVAKKLKKYAKDISLDYIHNPYVH
ncbi:MAG TPA: hypothetical protein VFV50_18960 [Bdellovibrionales bacterium]|nr:hypothetical protein [Bdellovibrionales bacterium]